MREKVLKTIISITKECQISLHCLILLLFFYYYYYYYYYALASVSSSP